MDQPDESTLGRAAAKWDLLEHPFYRAWSAGTLPVETLALYGAEYGDFIGSVAGGWECLGESAIAAVERDHAELWDRFARSLGAPVRPATIPAVQALSAELRRSAESIDTAVGALHAFESQQPKVARSKLDGLEQHYRSRTPGLSVEYFQAHVDDYAEPALLEARMATLDPAGRTRAAGAADRMGRALWSALDGILASSR